REGGPGARAVGGRAAGAVGPRGRGPRRWAWASAPPLRGPSGGASTGRDLCDLQLQRASAVDEEGAPGREVRPTDPPQTGAEQRVAVHVAPLQQEAAPAGLA